MIHSDLHTQDQDQQRQQQALDQQQAASGQCKAPTCKATATSPSVYCEAHVCPNCSNLKTRKAAACSKCTAASRCRRRKCTKHKTKGDYCNSHACPDCDNKKGSKHTKCKSCRESSSSSTVIQTTHYTGMFTYDVSVGVMFT